MDIKLSQVRYKSLSLIPYAIIAFLFFVAGLLVEITVTKLYIKDIDKSHPVRQNNKYTFINPLLECDTYSDTNFQELKPFKEEIEKIIKEKINKNQANHISIYFRDMNNGPWFGINEQENFSPASLLKVPLMITYLKLAEDNPNTLNQVIQVNNPAIFNFDSSMYYQPGNKIEFGKAYTIDDLLERMIVYSDNSAMILLDSNIKQQNDDQTFSDLGIRILSPGDIEDNISVKDYATFFRVLFNSSYLNKNMSEKGLKLLSRVEYKKGLSAGIDANILISHKFGERIFPENNIRELHDCGIIYYPNHPYLLCIMTKGNNFDNLSDVIKSLSSAVYNEIKNQFPLPSTNYGYSK